MNFAARIDDILRATQNGVPIHIVVNECALYTPLHTLLICFRFVPTTQFPIVLVYDASYGFLGTTLIFSRTNLQAQH